MLSHPSPQVERQLFSSSPSNRCSYSLASIGSDDASLSDKENFPSCTFENSNQVRSDSPTMKTLLQISPTKTHMSFTPQRMRPLPRAWERRPATPFVSRNEGQKIWKRIPLQELNIEAHQQMSKHEREGKENYVRIVKRLRLDAEDVIAQRVDCDEVVLAIGTKWEEENIENGGSPKKKSSVKLHAPGFLSNEFLMEGDRTSEDQAQSRNTRAQTNPIEQPVLNTNPPPSDTLDTQNPSQSKLLNDENKEKHENDVSNETTSLDAGKPVKDEVKVVNVDAPMEIEVSSHVVNCVHTEELTQVKVIASPEKKESATSTESPAHHVDSLVILDEDSNTLSEPNDVLTPAAFNQDSLPVAESELSINTSTSTSSNVLDSLPSQPALVLQSSDHDETAFLRDFLERAQASKAAKIILSPQKKIASLPPVMKTVSLTFGTAQSEDTDAIDDIEDDHLSPPIESTKVEQMYSDADLKATSPTHRSARTASRTATSRLPRFHVPSTQRLGNPLSSRVGTVPLPNTIQLKRATGNEFIFNAKSQQTLIMMTRSNTKRNQNGSVHVPHRLAQLKVELDVSEREQAATEAPAEGESDGKLETIDDAGTATRVVSKKRKRDKEVGKPSKMKRNVKWPSDDELVRYREASPFIETPEEGKDCNDAQTPMLPTLEILHSEGTCDTTKLVETPSNALQAGLKAKKTDPSEESSKYKVRRIRKIKLDSVNGTPAPKTRSRTNTDSQETTSEIHADFSDKSAASASNSSSNTRRSSRMPVPISTPIPLPSFTATKSKSKNVDQSRERTTIKIPRDSEATQTTTTTTSQALPVKDTAIPSDSDRKFDPRRRLRERG